MSQETAPTPPKPEARSASAEKQALLEAYDTVLKHQAETRDAVVREAEARRAARGKIRAFVWTSAAITMVLCAYLLIERPDWLFPAVGAPEATEVQEASLRISMANAAQHIQRFYQQNSRLPETLAEAGAYGEGLEYTRIGTGWRMTAMQGTTQLSLSSRDALATFIGRSFEVIARRAP
ncbi:MAG TPA: hypothetical protein VJQ44_16010 [Gemmatimonadales bacterium]|nr:hypothetical protein [Gemmatimonadales bacterium]